MDKIEVSTEYGLLSFTNEEKANFFKSFGDKSIKEIFKLDESESWLKKTSFWDLKLSTRAQNTISTSFDERTTSKQTIYYVVTNYTPALMSTRRNVGQSVCFEFMRVLYEFISAQDKQSNNHRNYEFNPEIFN